MYKIKARNIIKKCPFCGKYPKIMVSFIGTYKIECVNIDCPCIPSTWYASTKANAIKMWNRRSHVR